MSFDLFTHKKIKQLARDYLSGDNIDLYELLIKIPNKEKCKQCENSLLGFDNETIFCRFTRCLHMSPDRFKQRKKNENTTIINDSTNPSTRSNKTKHKQTKQTKQNN